MTLFSEHNAPQNTEIQWDPTDQLLHVQDHEESEITRSSFYKDVFRPAWKSLEDAAATLFLEWFSGGLSIIGQLASTYNANQRAKEIRHYHESPKRKSPQALPIPLEAPLGLRKIIKDSGNTGSFTVDNQDRPDGRSTKPLAKTNPWLEATKKQKCVINVQPPKAEKPNRSYRASKKAILEEEPNRGLDDIYTTPVSGIFAEDKEFGHVKPVANSQWKKAIGPGVNTQTIAAMIDAELDQLMPGSKRKKPANIGKNQPQVSSFNWMNETLAQPQAGQQPHESEFIPGFSIPEPEPQQRFVEEKSAEIGSKVSSNPGSGASLMLAKAKAANTNFRRQMPVYQEMKTEMSGADHMVRNNRILHNSISNLADSYFKKAAAEERANNP